MAAEYLDLEGGTDDLLLETGDKLLLESSTDGGRTALNTRAFPLGVNVGMGWRMTLCLFVGAECALLWCA